jgi:hypothetical protein
MVGIPSGVDDPGGVIVAKPSWMRSGSNGDDHVNSVIGTLVLAFLSFTHNVGVVLVSLTCEMDSWRSASVAWFG